MLETVNSNIRTTEIQHPNEHRNQHRYSPNLADRNIPNEMARKASNPRYDDEHRRLLSRQLDQLRTIIRRRLCSLAIPTRLPILLLLHSVGYNTLATRVSSVSIPTNLFIDNPTYNRFKAGSSPTAKKKKQSPSSAASKQNPSTTQS